MPLVFVDIKGLGGAASGHSDELDLGAVQIETEQHEEPRRSRLLGAIHDTADLALYGLPSGLWGWIAELDARDLADLGYGDSSGFSATVIGLYNWDPSPGAMWPDPGARYARPLFRGGTNLDIVYIEARMEGTDASLVWSRQRPDERGRLDARHIEQLHGKRLKRFLRARRLAALDMSSIIGRPVGSQIIPETQFRDYVERAVRKVRQRRDRVTQAAVANELGVSLGTLQTCLADYHANWQELRTEPR